MTIWFAGTRLSEQPIHRYSGSCCCDSLEKYSGFSLRRSSAHARFLSNRCFKLFKPNLLRYALCNLRMDNIFDSSSRIASFPPRHPANSGGSMNGLFKAQTVRLDSKWNWDPELSWRREAHCYTNSEFVLTNLLHAFGQQHDGG